MICHVCNNEYADYYIKKSVWAKSGLPLGAPICLSDLNARLPSPVTIDDFDTARPVNYNYLLIYKMGQCNPLSNSITLLPECG